MECLDASTGVFKALSKLWHGSLKVLLRECLDASTDASLFAQLHVNAPVTHTARYWWVFICATCVFAQLRVILQACLCVSVFFFCVCMIYLYIY